MTIVFERVT